MNIAGSSNGRTDASGAFNLGSNPSPADAQGGFLIHHRDYVINNIMLKQVIVVRKDLKLSKGKLATQVAHAALLAADKSKLREEWKKEGQKKIVLWCDNLKELFFLYETARNFNLPCALVSDAGLTEVEPGTKTCLGIGPAPEEKIDKITGNLKLI